MIFYLIIIALAVPTGFLIAHMARDELVLGRKWFRIIFTASFIAGLWFFLIGVEYIALTLFFIVIFSLINYIKSFDKKLTKKKLK